MKSIPMPMSKFCAVGAILVGTCLMPMQSWAQPRAAVSPSLQQKVDELSATTQHNFEELAKAMNTFNELKSEIQSVKGQLDSTKYVTNENDKVYQDLDTRVSALEDKIGQIHAMLKEMKVGAPDPVAPAAMKPNAAATPTIQHQEYDEFQRVLNLFNAQDFRGTASGMMGFLKKYPQSSLAGNAQFWVAESYYAMGDYVKAIAEYQILSEKYPTHPRIREAIYKQGAGFQKLKKYPEAKLFYQKVIANYPNTPEALKAQARLARMETLDANGQPVALEMNPASSPPKPTPSPKPPADAVYNRPTTKPIPHPGANPPPNSPKIPNTPEKIPANPPAPAPAPAPAPSQPTEPKVDNSGAPLF